MSATVRRVLAVALVATCAACSTHAEQSTSPSTSPSSTSQPTSIAPTSTATTAAGVEPSSSPAPAPSPAASDVDVPDLALPTHDASSQASAQARAEGFVRAWARPDLQASQWWAGVRGFLTPAAAQLFRYTDPANVPATQVTGSARVVGEPTATSVLVEVPTDAGMQQVLVVRGAQDEPWQVASLTGPEA